ncbi:uncharacterized protein LOC114273005 [Camellia sinensis]|uniref:uncharacterized protein LOC114273005 n=1 Tax=Camellia sinensis TaxID=4442 RepID=UPI00103582A7|nr:uncharacterized protein LOC114273005 [Camellia sinensis]
MTFGRFGSCWTPPGIHQSRQDHDRTGKPPTTTKGQASPLIGHQRDPWHNQSRAGGSTSRGNCKSCTDSASNINRSCTEKETSATGFAEEKYRGICMVDLRYLGLDPKFACHKLNVNPSARPVIQKSRRFSIQHTKVVIAEMDKLLIAGAIREVQYPQWLSNIVVVKKKNGKWRVCVDFTCLNKIPLFCPYQEKITFITPRGTYCYKAMPFGLKNAEATYQRMVTRMFKNQLGQTMEAYIDGMVVKKQACYEPPRRSKRSFQHPENPSTSPQCLEMRFHSRNREVLGLYGYSQRNRSKPRLD